MLEIKIKKNNVQTHGATFETQDLADAWLEQGAEAQWWGKPSGWYPILELTEEELATEIERREVESFGNVLIEIHIPAQYTVEITDITAEVEAQKKMQDALTAQTLGNQIICKVWAINDAKNLTVEQMQAIFGDQQVAAIERCLRNGALLTAKALIVGLDTTIFTADEKQTILDMFN